MKLVLKRKPSLEVVGEKRRHEKQGNLVYENRKQKTRILKLMMLVASFMKRTRTRERSSYHEDLQSD